MAEIATSKQSCSSRKRYRQDSKAPLTADSGKSCCGPVLEAYTKNSRKNLLQLCKARGVDVDKNAEDISLLTARFVDILL